LKALQDFRSVDSELSMARLKAFNDLDLLKKSAIDSGLSTATLKALQTYGVLDPNKAKK
jgi:hypothetical protein